MFRLFLAVTCLTLTGIVAIPQARAETRPVEDCVGFTENLEATTDQYLGWLRNICEEPIAVVHDFGLNPDGSPKDGPWCSDRMSDTAYLQNANLLDPGETLGVGWRLKGVATAVHWAACTVDTSRNNSVFFLQLEPEFRFLPSCNFECEYNNDLGSSLRRELSQ